MYTPSVILLVGAGNLGSRYLEGITTFREPLNVVVVDPSRQSLDLAHQRLAQVSSTTPRNFAFSTTLDVKDYFVDLVIVATPADCRLDIVTGILSKHVVGAWILEKVLAQSEAQLDRLAEVLGGHPRVWVNTTRRLQPWHQFLRRVLNTSSHVPLRVRVSGGNWGLACNAIHYIDFVAWLRSTVVKSVAIIDLGSWFVSKRPGFYEVLGSLSVEFADNSLLTLECDGSSRMTEIEIETEYGSWLINESAGTALGPDGSTNAGRMLFQSEITAPLVTQILRLGSCQLTTLDESISQHRPLLTALLNHWNEDQERSDSAVPIT